jgi:integrase/recombinase XerD
VSLSRCPEEHESDVREGLGTIYAHRLRHIAASSLAQGGWPAEIGQVLRHRP